MGNVFLMLVIVGAVVLALGVADRKLGEEDLARQELQPRAELYR